MASAIESLSFLSSLSQRIKIEPTKLCTTLSKHGALYPRAVDLPRRGEPLWFAAFFRAKCGFTVRVAAPPRKKSRCACAVRLQARSRRSGLLPTFCGFSTFPQPGTGRVRCPACFSFSQPPKAGDIYTPFPSVDGRLGRLCYFLTRYL